MILFLCEHALSQGQCLDEAADVIDMSLEDWIPVGRPVLEDARIGSPRQVHFGDLGTYVAFFNPWYRLRDQ